MALPNDKRLDKIQRVVNYRQPNLSLVLENVHDTHNIGAVMRTAESVGVLEIYILYTHKHLKRQQVKLGKRTSSGARKWMDVHLFNDADKCFEKIQEKYDKILGAYLGEDSQSLYDLDLTQSTALVFGNEHEGISDETLSYCNGEFLIPQFGMTQSLNISVACAVSLYEASRQRINNGMYEDQSFWPNIDREGLLKDYLDRHSSRYRAQKIQENEND